MQTSAGSLCPFSARRGSLGHQALASGSVHHGHLGGQRHLVAADRGTTVTSSGTASDGFAQQNACFLREPGEGATELTLDSGDWGPAQGSVGENRGRGCNLASNPLWREESKGLEKT